MTQGWCSMMFSRICWLTVLLLTAAVDVGFGQAPPAPATAAAATEQNENLKKAVERFRQNDVEGAMKELEAAVVTQPDLAPPRVMLANLFLNSNNVQTGRNLLERAVIDQPDHPDVYRAFGELAIAEGRTTDAALAFEKSLALASGDRWPAKQRERMLATCYGGLATVAERRNDWNQAYAQLYVWLKLEPKNAIIMLRIGRALFFLNKPDDSLKALQQAAALDKRVEPAELSMGRLWSQKSDPKKAEPWFRQGIQNHPKDARGFAGLATFLMEQSKNDEARAMAEQAVTLDGKTPEYRRLQGFIARQAKDYEAAEKIFQELSQQSPSDFSASNHLALSLAGQADEKKRRRGLEIATVNARQYPRVSEALASLGWAQYRAGNLAEAERALQAAANTGQMGSDAAYYLAMVLRDRGKLDDAKKWLQTALNVPGAFVHRQDAAALLETLASAGTGANNRK